MDSYFKFEHQPHMPVWHLYSILMRTGRLELLTEQSVSRESWLVAAGGDMRFKAQFPSPKPPKNAVGRVATDIQCMMQEPNLNKKATAVCLSLTTLALSETRHI